MSTLAVLAERNGLPLVTAMAWRYTLGSALLLYPALHALRHSRVAIPADRVLRLALIGSIGQGAVTFISLYALNYVAVGLLAFLFYTYPAWLALISTVRRSEAITATRAAALAISLLGIAVMIGPISAATVNPKGVLIALGGALLYAIYLPALGNAQQGIPPMFATFLVVFGATISFVLVAVVTGNTTSPSSVRGWLIVLLLGTVCTFVAFSALLKGLRSLGPVRTSIIGTIEPFFTAILGALVLGELLTARIFIGGTMIATAVVLLQLRPDERIPSVVIGDS